MAKTLTAPEVAKRKGVTRAAVILAIKRGTLKAQKARKGAMTWWEIDPASVAAWKPQHHKKARRA